jgi:hypothetical protein
VTGLGKTNPDEEGQKVARFPDTNWTPFPSFVAGLEDHGLYIYLSTKSTIRSLQGKHHIFLVLLTNIGAPPFFLQSWRQVDLQPAIHESLCIGIPSAWRYIRSTLFLLITPLSHFLGIYPMVMTACLPELAGAGMYRLITSWLGLMTLHAVAPQASRLVRNGSGLHLCVVRWYKHNLFLPTLNLHFLVFSRISQTRSSCCSLRVILQSAYL